MSALSALAVFCATLLYPRRSGSAGLTRLEHRQRPGASRAVAALWWTLAPVLLLIVAISVGGGSGCALTVSLGVPAATLVWAVRAQRRRRLAGLRRDEVVRSCQILAGLLRVGHVPASSLAAACLDAPLLAEPAAVHGIGGDVGPVLRRMGSIPGQEGLVELANAWEVSERTGASMMATLDALAERLVADTSLRNIVRAELSAPRATGRILGALPLVGLALGYSLGGDPLGYLIGSTIGQVCLVAGVVLGCLGVVWTERIANGDGGGRGLG